MKNQTLNAINYATEKLKENNQTLREYQKNQASRILIKSRDSIQNRQIVQLHLNKCPYVKIEKNIRDKLGFFMKKGFESHHLNGNKTDDSIENLVVVREENHNFCDFHGTKYILGLITGEEYINTIKPFIVWEVE